MRRSAFDEHRDQRVADEASREAKADKALMCRASGCPHRWSVASEGRMHLCSAHAWADPVDWPRITQHLEQAEFDRMRGASSPAPAPSAPRMTRAQVMAKLRNLRFAAPSKAWAEKLRDREQRGERLSGAQKAMWRQALGQVASTDDFFAVEPEHA